MADGYITPGSFSAFISPGREAEFQSARQSAISDALTQADFYRSLRSQSLKDAASAPTESREQLAGMALMGILPILIGLAARGKKGAAIGALAGGKGVEGYAGQLAKDLNQQKELSKLQATQDEALYKQKLSDVSALEKMGIKYLGDKALLPEKTAQAAYLAGVRGDISRENTAASQGKELMGGASLSDMIEGDPDITEMDLKVSMPSISDPGYGLLQEIGTRKFGSGFQLADATQTQERQIRTALYEEVKAKGDPNAEAFNPSVIENQQNDLIRRAKNYLTKGMGLTGIPQPKTYAQAQSLASFALAWEKAKGIGRPITESMASQLATNISIRSDIAQMKQFISQMGDDEIRLISKMLGKEKGEAAARGAKAGQFAEAYGIKDLPLFGKSLDKLIRAGTIQPGSPEYNFASWGNMLATKYAQLYNGKRLSDMDFQIFKELVAVSDMAYAGKDALLMRLDQLERESLKSYRTQWTTWERAGWAAPKLDDITSPAQVAPTAAKWFERFNQRRV